MRLSKTIFRHPDNDYKLILSVYEHFNDYLQQCYTAVIQLYTKDNLLLTEHKHDFSRLTINLDNDINNAYMYFYNELSKRFNNRALSFDLYLKHLRDKSEGDQKHVI